MKEAKLDLALYSKEQIVEAMTCPLNRHGTREEHGWCSDEDLHRNPGWLMTHFIDNGGAKEFAKRRAEFLKLCDLMDHCRLGEVCRLALILSGWTHCPIRHSDHCRKGCSNHIHVEPEEAG